MIWILPHSTSEMITELLSRGLVRSFVFFHLSNFFVNSPAFLTASLSPTPDLRVRLRLSIKTTRPTDRILPCQSRLVPGLGPHWRPRLASGREWADRVLFGCCPAGSATNGVQARQGAGRAARRHGRHEQTG